MRSKFVATVTLAAVATLAAGCATAVGGQGVANPNAIAGIGAPSSGTPAPFPTADPTASAPTGSSAPTASAPAPPGPTTSAEPAPTAPTAPTAPGTTTPAPTGSGGTPPATGYPTKPRELPEFPETDGSAALLEGRRLADWVLVPTQIFPEYHKGASMSTLPFRGPSAMGMLFTDPVPQVAERAGLITGFSSARSTDKGDSLIIAVFEFATADAAKNGAKAISDAAKGDGEKPVAGLPGFKDAIGWTGPTYDKGVMMHTFLPVGPLVVYAWAESPDTKKNLADIITKTYLRQVVELKTFVPTPKDKLMTLRLDPDGMAARTLPRSDGKTYIYDGVYSGKAFLHFVYQPKVDEELFARTGVDQVSALNTTVYRARDLAGATTVAKEFYEFTKKRETAMVDMKPPAGLQNAFCLENPLSAEYYCTVATGRYVFEYWSEDATDLEKALTAQVAMLNAP